jgi:hypothetical protein
MFLSVAGPKRTTTITVRLGLEGLESRVLPADKIYLWWPITTNPTWDEVVAGESNWRVRSATGVWEATGEIPTLPVR